jgi:hypothetical protein
MGAITENVYAFHNPGGLQFGVVDPVTRASAIAMTAPNALVSTISGTAQMTTIALPYPGFTGFIIYRPTAAFTGATGGTSDGTNMAIGLAFTAVIGKALMMVFDGALWWPSYTN